MLKRVIEYTDYNGNKVSETHYFNLNKTEILEMEGSLDGRMEERLTRIVNTNDRAGLIAEFKKFILAAYGVKSDDGRRFIKSDELRDEFVQTAAYEALFMELATDDKAASDFILGLLPKDVAEGTLQQLETNTTSSPPPPPPPPVSGVQL